MKLENLLPFFLIQEISLALTDVSQRVGHFPMNREVTDLSHGQSARLGRELGLQITHLCFSPSLFPSLPLSLKINKIFFLKKEISLKSFDKMHLI